MNGPINFNPDSFSFSRGMHLQLNNSGNNSIAFNDMDTRFPGIDMEPMNFNHLEGSLENRLNRELGFYHQTENNDMAIPSSPIPSSPDTNLMPNSIFHNEVVPGSINQPAQESYMAPYKETRMPNKNPPLEPLVLYPFRSIFDVEICVRQMRAYESLRCGHTNNEDIA